MYFLLQLQLNLQNERDRSLLKTTPHAGCHEIAWIVGSCLHFGFRHCNQTRDRVKSSFTCSWDVLNRKIQILRPCCETPSCVYSVSCYRTSLLCVCRVWMWINLSHFFKVNRAWFGLESMKTFVSTCWRHAVYQRIHANLICFGKMWNRSENTWQILQHYKSRTFSIIYQFHPKRTPN